MNEEKVSLESLMNKLQEEKYKAQGYAPGTKVEISSDLFTDIVNLLNFFTETLDKVQATSLSIASAINSVTTETDKLQVRLGEQHIENVDKGITVDESVLDAMDAEVKIEETKE